LQVRSYEVSSLRHLKVSGRNVVSALTATYLHDDFFLRVQSSEEQYDVVLWMYTPVLKMGYQFYEEAQADLEGLILHHKGYGDELLTYHAGVDADGRKFE
jgi:hypothetical protein